MEFIVMLFLAGAVGAHESGHERSPSPPPAPAAVAATPFPFPQNWETTFPKNLDTLFQPIKTLCPKLTRPN